VFYVSSSQTISGRTTVDWSKERAFRQNGSPYNVTIDDYAAPKVAITLIIRNLILRIGTLSFVWQTEGAFQYIALSHFMVLWSAIVSGIQKVPFQNLELENRYSAWRLLTFLIRTAFTSKEATAISFHIVYNAFCIY